MLNVELTDAPNFIRAEEGYQKALQSFLARRNLGFLKVGLASDATLPQPTQPGTLCIHAAASPRGDYKHCVVATVAEDGKRLELAWDPHREGNGLVPHAEAWAGFFVPTDPAAPIAR